jgi:hypothetical protein
VEWLWLPALLAGVVFGFWFGAKAAMEGAKPDIEQLAETQAYDRNNYLRILRRELANHLVQRDANSFERLYEKLHHDIARYETFSKEALAGEFRALVERFPQYDDFDLIGTRQHVLYPDALSSHDDDDVREHFRSIVRFQALNAKLDNAWSRFRATSEDDLNHLRKYACEVQDIKFRKRLKSAIDLFYLARGEDRDAFETRDFSVVRVSHIAEVRYGVHFKDTDEYGLYGAFYGDKPEPYESYYRSDRMFEDEGSLRGFQEIDYQPSKQRFA